MRKSTLVAAVACLSAAVVLAAGPAGPPPTSSSMPAGVTRVPGDRHVLVALPYSAGTRVPAPDSMRARLIPQNAATVNVTYVGFGAFPAAQAAFQHAVNIWQSQITSSVPITMRAEFAPLGAAILGSAGPTSIARDFAGAPQAGVWYPIALAEKLEGAEGNSGQFDIDATFNSTFSNWYFGTDGNPASNQYDFVSVVLHELGHGLGFIGSMNVASGIGDWGFGTGFPFVFDTLAVNGSVQSLINLSLFPNPSASLASQLQSNNVFWNGAAGRTANGGNRPKLYAPGAWEDGSSFSHLDELTFPAGNPNSLMTYALAQDEAIHSPGPIVLGMFRDMGWTATNCTYSINPTSVSVAAGGSTGLVTVTTQAGCGWSAISNSAFVTITSANSGSGNGTVAYTVAQNTNVARSATLTIAGHTFTINQAAACTYSINPISDGAPAAGTTGSVTVTTQPGCAWTAASHAAFLTITSPTSALGSGVVTYTVDPNGVSYRVGTMTIAGRTFQLFQLGTGPTLSHAQVSPLIYGATTNGNSFVTSTLPQTVRLIQTGSGTITWTATTNQPWLIVSPVSGTGPATLTISVAPAFGVPSASSVTGQVSIATTGAGAPAPTILTRLNTYVDGTSSPPFGSFDSPVNNATGVTGSLPVTGWALDDVQVGSVAIYRDAVTGEAAGLKFIGHAVLVSGARPDIAGAPQYSGFPLNTRAGWGYMLLTNVLPNWGNGTYVLHAYATDREGRQTLLGSRTITCTNATAVKPFGAIDTPAQGATIGGTSYNNFGWVLSPGAARADVPGGGSVTVFIDGAPVGSPGLWSSRPDISALFPEAEYAGVNFAQAVYTFDPSTYAEGVHTISWTVFDNMGNGAGIGSRYFTITRGPALTAASSALLTLSVADEVLAAPRDRTALAGRRGYDLSAPYRQFRPDSHGTTTIHGEEIDRFELQFHAPPEGTALTGHLLVGRELRPLPIGSTLDARTGLFMWQPGVGFIGAYDLVFVRWADGRALSRQDVRIVLNPQGSGRVGPQVVIDLPAPVSYALASVTQPFIVAGWAADLDAWSGTGIATLHVWAYPAAGGTPIFLGATAYGGMRPDVGAVFGDRFTESGFSLTVRHLPPGDYLLAVFGYSLVQNGFVPAKTVSVSVR